MGLGPKTSVLSDKDDEDSATASYKLSASDKTITNGMFVVFVQLFVKT